MKPVVFAVAALLILRAPAPSQGQVPSSPAAASTAPVTAEEWNDRAQSATAARDFETAIFDAKQAYTLRPESLDYFQKCLACYVAAGKFEGGGTFAEAALAALPSTADLAGFRSMVGTYERGRCQSLTTGGQYADAAGHCERAVDLHADVPNELAQDLIASSGLEFVQGHSKEAIDFAERAASIGRQRDDQRLIGQAEMTRAMALVETGDAAAVDAAFHAAVTAARAAGDKSIEAFQLQMAGEGMLGVAKADRARDYFSAGAALAEEIGSPRRQVGCLHGLGKCDLDLFHYDQAVQELSHAADLAETGGLSLDETGVLATLADANARLNRYDKAVVYQTRSVDAAHRGGYAAVELIKRATLISYLGFAGSLEPAISLSQDVIEQARTAGDPMAEVTARYAVGDAYAAAGDYPHAADALSAAMTAARDRHAVLLLQEIRDELASVLILGNRAKDADPVIDEMIDEGTAAGTAVYECEGYTLRMLSEVEQGRPELALEAMQRGLTFQANDALVCQASLLSYGMDVERGLKRPAAAVLYGKQSVNLFQSINAETATLDDATRRKYRERSAATYRSLAELLAAQGRLAEAQQVIGMMKGREFYDFVRRDESAAASLGTVSLTPAEAAWRKQYDAIADDVTAIGRRRDDLLQKQKDANLGVGEFTAADKALLAKADQDLTVANQAFQAFLDKLPAEFDKPAVGAQKAFDVGEAAGLSDTLAQLGPGTVALYTIVEPERYRVIVITSQTQKAEEYTIKQEDLSRKVLALREALQDPTLDPRPLAADLYKILIGPIQKDLDGARATTLMWSLDGVLRYLPMAVLYDGKQYLVEKYRSDVFTLASRSRLADAPPSTWTALGMGVSKSHPGFEALPSVPAELYGVVHDDSPSLGRRGLGGGSDSASPSPSPFQGGGRGEVAVNSTSPAPVQGEGRGEVAGHSASPTPVQGEGRGEVAVGSAASPSPFQGEGRGEVVGVLPGTVMLDDKFTKDSMVAALESGHFPVVHIASHFAFRPGDDTDSFLLLGDGAHLSLADIKTMPQIFQGVDLLTLSACETAMGSRGADGREVEGCAVIAQRQGARAVLASLWPVADASTQALMRTFYQYRATHPNSSKAEALQQAQLALLHGTALAAPTPVRGAGRGEAAGHSATPSPFQGEGRGEVAGHTTSDDPVDNLPEFPADQNIPFAHPYFWAPFILIGNWK